MTSQPSIDTVSRTDPPRPRVRDGSLERALRVILALALILAVAQLGAGSAYSTPFWPVAAFTIVFLTWIAAGLIAWWRRPGNGVGPLIIVGGIAIYLGGIANVPAPLFVFLNSIFATSVLAVTVHILHAFPSGRLRGRLSIAAVIAGYVVAIGFDIVTNLLPPVTVGGLELFEEAQTVLGIGVMTVTAVVLARRLVAADARHRRVLLPMFAYGTLAVLLVPTIPVIARALELDREVVGLVQLAVIACLPIAFLLGVLLGGFRRTTALEALSAWLAIDGATRPAAGRALAATLGDESLRVAYWSSDRGAFVDEAGAAIERDEHDPGRGWVDVRVGDRLVGEIGYDTRMIGDPSEVRRAGEVLAIAIDRELLTAELLASNKELTRSRLRLVEAAYRERSRIARDLHDGLQVQLVLLALEAQTIANSADAAPAVSAASEQLRRGIDAAAADLRSLVHNVLPASLLEQGLTAAIEDLVDRLEIPATLAADLDEHGLSDATVHTAFFVLAELLSNAVKHSRASSVHVSLGRADGRLVVEMSDDGVGGARMNGGTGLRGLVDRVAAIDGTIEIASDPGTGTRVKVELPCE
ncbi:sensor histidine kinase [Agromyces aureus]|uniref:histidine kinase n=1 Tax=Agromyces aureus TaxID=453304 RepID=A0A191WI39_9MICO|nr:histidine kinase [Agromyces aureus]ANJ27975.1 ATPase [Agromyces aureus]